LGTKSAVTLTNEQIHSRFWKSHQSIPMEEQMPTRMTFFVPAILTICLATVCLSVQASRAADDCIIKPNAPSPQGSHWYYRVDRTTHRECWYLGPEGAKVHQRVRQAASPARPLAPKLITRSTAQTPADATTAAAAPSEITAGETRSTEDDSTAALSMRWSGLPTSAASIDRGPVSMSNSYAEEQSATASEDEMPLIWPILTPAELGASERPTALTISFAQLVAALAAVLGLAALIVRTIVRLSAARKPDRPHARERRESAAHPDMVRRTVKATSDPAVEIEASVRQLLHELQRRRHEDHRGEFPRTSRHVMA
jgi:hypothetical protein